MTSIFCILGFVVGFLIYRQGIKDGMMKAKDGRLERMVSLPKKAKKNVDVETSYAKGMASILNYRNRDERRKED